MFLIFDSFVVSFSGIFIYGHADRAVYSYKLCDMPSGHCPHVYQVQQIKYNQE